MWGHSEKSPSYLWSRRQPSPDPEWAVLCPNICHLPNGNKVCLWCDSRRHCCGLHGSCPHKSLAYPKLVDVTIAYPSWLMWPLRGDWNFFLVSDNIKDQFTSGIVIERAQRRNCVRWGHHCREGSLRLRCAFDDYVLPYSSSFSCEHHLSSQSRSHDIQSQTQSNAAAHLRQNPFDPSQLYPLHVVCHQHVVTVLQSGWYSGAWGGREGPSARDNVAPLTPNCICNLYWASPRVVTQQL